MKTFKTLFALIALLLCCTSIFAHDFEVNKIYYNITSEADKTVEVTYQGNFFNSYSNEYSGSVTIPESVTYNGITYSVTSIRGYAFSGCSDLTSIEIPNSVIKIDDSAFSGTTWYNNKPDGLVYINNVLYGYKGIMPANTSIDIKDGTVYISPRAFYNCSGLTSVTIPNSVTSIGDYAFYGCSGLASIEIPKGVAEIGGGAFEKCSSLASVNIPNSVKSIYCCTFNGCTGLKELIIEDSNEPLESILDCNIHASHFDDFFFEDSPIEHMYIGRDLNNYTLGSYVEWRKTLNKVEIGNGMTTVPNSIFDSCYELSSVTLSNSVRHIGRDAFRNCDGFNTVVLPNSLRSIGKSAFRACSNLEYMTIPQSVDSIESNPFGETEKLISIVVEEGNLKYDSRYECNAIIETSTNTLISGCNTTVIPCDVVSINNSAFTGCLGLTSVEIPISVKK